MTLQMKAFQQSLGIHSAILALCLLAGSWGTSPRTMVIDFSLLDTKRPPAVGEVLMSKDLAAVKPERRSAVVEEKPETRTEPSPVINSEKAEKPEPAVEQSAATVTPSPVHEQASAPGSGTPSAVAPSAAAIQTAGMNGVARQRSFDPAEGRRSDETTDSREHSKTQYLREHFAYIRDAILRGVAYPQTARKMGWSGKVKVGFIILENGGVHDVRILASSGCIVLDRNAVETIKRTAPFPCPPVKADIVMAINYTLR